MCEAFYVGNCGAKKKRGAFCIGLSPHQTANSLVHPLYLLVEKRGTSSGMCGKYGHPGVPRGHKQFV